jgi:Uma2 family endonuclease
MTTPAAVRFTYQDYLNLPEESRYEIIDGDLQMSPSPSTRHQRIVGKLYECLLATVRERGLGEVFIAPLDVVLSTADVVQPDVFFVSTERAAIVKEKGVFGAPDLVVEVLSSASAERDRTVKAKLYARAGVAELWLVDAEARTIEVLVNGPGGFVSHSKAAAGQAPTSKVLGGPVAGAEKILG